jgi:hypothetical protein
VTPGTDDSAASDLSKEDEATLTKELREKAAIPSMQNSHLPTILPLSEQQRLQKEREQAEASHADQQVPEIPQKPPMTAQQDAAILELAHNDDLNIATIARQAKKAHGDELADEVVISLH